MYWVGTMGRDSAPIVGEWSTAGSNVLTVFLDRDGVLVDEAGHPDYGKSGPVILAGVRSALTLLASTGASIAIVTNQSAVARGRLSRIDAVEVHERILATLDPERRMIRCWAMCPHDAADSCGCRKPRLGMPIALRERYRVSTTSGWFVGDQSSDVRCGHGLGLRTALTAAPDLERFRRGIAASPDLVVGSLDDAAAHIASDLRRLTLERAPVGGSENES